MRRGDAHGFAVEQDLPFIWSDDSAEDLEQRRLPGAISPYQGVDLAGGDVEADRAHGVNAAIAFRDAAERQHYFGAPYLWAQVFLNDSRFSLVISSSFP